MDDLWPIDIFDCYNWLYNNEDIVQDKVRVRGPSHHRKCPCGKTASYGLEGGKKLFCAKCKQPNHIIIGKPKCICGKIAMFGPPNTKDKLTCSKCKLPGYVNLVTKRCPCGTICSYGCPIERKKIACVKCKLPYYIQLSNSGKYRK